MIKTKNCENCRWFSEYTNLLFGNCIHFKSQIVPFWYTEYKDKECPNFEDKEIFIKELTEKINNIIKDKI